ncbi:MAG: DUF3109 family protein [Ignavibacteriae bacterium]|nr:DUF3109 family protein [Ignavibacteriota bacterium]
MILIDNILLEEEITETSFSCDLQKCKGACCTFPGKFGAPLKDEEIEMIYNNLDNAKKYLSEKSIEYIDKHGFYEGSRDNYSTVCIDKKDCVFVYYENSVAKYTKEKAYFNCESNFRKPISCHLFPIRVNNTGRKYLYFQNIAECKPALKKGKSDKVNLVNFSKDALIRAYGEESYNEISEYVKNNGIPKAVSSIFGGVNETVS